MKNFITPDWPAPKNIFAATTTRMGGVSKSTYESFNLGLYSGDNKENVLANREILKQELNIPNEPFWITQQHTNIAIELTKQNFTTNPIADASFTREPNLVCVTLTADCVPILICDRQGTIVAAIHAGWKGIQIGIIESTIKAMNSDPTQLLAWLGPAIGPTVFEVGNTVRDLFLASDSKATLAFKPHNDRWLANIYLLASQRLHAAGVTAVFGGEYCTYSQADLFFSYRRDGAQSGRMASLIMIKKIYPLPKTIRYISSSSLT